MNLRPLLRVVAWTLIVLAALQTAGAIMFLSGAVEFAINGPMPSDPSPPPGPLGMLETAIKAASLSFAYWTAGLLAFRRFKAAP